MNDFSSMIQYLRKRSNLTQNELADKLGVANTTVSMWETGRRRPDFEMLETLADFFNVDINFILGVDKEKLVNPVWDDEQAKENAELFMALPKDKQEEALKYMRYLASLAQDLRS